MPTEPTTIAALLERWHYLSTVREWAAKHYEPEYRGYMERALEFTTDMPAGHDMAVVVKTYVMFSTLVTRYRGQHADIGDLVQTLYTIAWG